MLYFGDNKRYGEGGGGRLTFQGDLTLSWQRREKGRKDALIASTRQKKN